MQNHWKYAYRLQLVPTNFIGKIKCYVTYVSLFIDFIYAQERPLGKDIMSYKTIENMLLDCNEFPQILLAEYNASKGLNMLF